MKTEVELRHEIKAARANGWTVERTQSDHIAFRPPAGLRAPDGELVPVLHCGSTPSPNVIRIVKGRLRKYGAIERK